METKFITFEKVSDRWYNVVHCKVSEIGKFIFNEENNTWTFSSKNPYFPTQIYWNDIKWAFEEYLERKR